MSQNHASSTRPAAFFDFDGTLTTGDTLMPFLKFVVGTPAYYTKLALVSPVIASYFSKLLRNDIAKQLVLKQYLAGYHIADLFERGQHFSEEVIPKMLRPEGMERLRWHQQQGHDCVLVSASLDAYLNAWAKQEGFSDVICTSLSIDINGIASGKIQGKNCYGEEKLRRLKEWQKEYSPVEKFGYGDTKSDISFLNHLDKGYLWKKKTKKFSPI
ncbi:HAD-IB family hydrolase [Marichromatium bheemlicum]|uniref:HAD-IB family hydrolase n=1 Tax=Marichromatium bheemlicum TaxID=365339 RepID=A0ABX1I5M8_9GAMM|nr:HAD-IB family hydrolase [Marichromatium bheemlicum]NKN32885.1 HAD-IB family hydrolase [Marichromatium bheemlicum]